jgi:alpha-galactosidase
MSRHRDEEEPLAGTGQSVLVTGWSGEGLELRIEVGGDGMARLTRLSAPGASAPGTADPGTADPGTAAAGGAAVPCDAALPLLDVIVSGEGRGWSGGRYCESEAGGRFRYTGHHEAAVSGSWHELRMDLDDPVTGLHAEVFYRILTGGGLRAAGCGLRAWVRLENRSGRPVTVESATSFLFGGLGTGPGPDDLADLDVMWAENDWMAEGRWQLRPLRDALPDINRRALGADPRGCFSLTSTGTWSSGRYLPAGAVVNRRTGHAWAWQIEHNGGWHWQVGECAHRSAPHGAGPHGRHAPQGAVSGAYLALLGPATTEHQWQVTLSPGESFTTVPASVTVSPDGFDGAVAGLTAIRRAIRRPHDDSRRLPVIFNDYMNTLMGSPTTERLLPLIAAAAGAGAEYFCIDSGWYAEVDQGWWDTVGAWRPSLTRFPGGLGEILDRITGAGMIPGLWLEPEVVGVNSEVARELPADAFFQRGGQRIVEHGRYHLDLRHPTAVKHLDQVVDYLVGDLGVGYLKLDYNIAIAPGPDTGGLSAGAGLLAANRAQLDWLDAVLDRHSGLVIENCSSGGMRTDYALLARLQLQSTSDQQEFLRYPSIAAAAPAAISPEQAAVWAYPQPEFSDDEIAFTMATAMLGRVHLSGHIDRMSARQRDMVAEAVRVYKEHVRSAIAGSAPFWPLGLPHWEDPWVALGLRAATASYLTIWRRWAAPGADAPRVTLPVPHLRSAPGDVQVLYPRDAGEDVSWDAARGTLTVTLPRCPSACVLRLA